MPELKITVEARELALKERFEIAREVWDSTTNVFVFASYGDAVGVGEAGPADRWGETVEGVIADLEAVDLSRLSGPFDLEGIADLLPAGSARCALDIAFHDLAATLAGLPLNEFLGLGGRSAPPTTVTVPIADVDRMVARATSLKDHPALKLKVGFDGDVDVVRKIRGVFDGAIRIDANEGWTPDEAIERLEALSELDIELCEQPIKGGNFDDLARVNEASPIPVFADEDVGDSKDVAALNGVVTGVNLKLRKTGGLRELLKAVAVARAQGMKVMLGCDLDTGVAATAGAHVASLMDFADLDGPLLLAEDPFPGVAYDKGRMGLPGGPGLGIRKDIA
jgi:L-alanine-DL-glutamate epimerase-like enolase superfamily enzyme